MKRFVAVLFLIPAMAFAQQNEEPIETLFDDAEGVRGFAGIHFDTARLNGQFTGMLGGTAAMSLNRKINIGITGQWLVNDVRTRNLSSEGRDLFYDVGYGGLLIEPTFFSGKKVHFTVPVVFGGGVIEEYRYLTPSAINGDSFDDTEYYHRDYFFVIEPGLAAELNLTRFLRLNLTGAYRLAPGLNLPNSADSELNQFIFRAGLRAGWF